MPQLPRQPQKEKSKHLAATKTRLLINPIKTEFEISKIFKVNQKKKKKEDKAKTIKEQKMYYPKNKFTVYSGGSALPSKRETVIGETNLKSKYKQFNKINKNLEKFMKL